MNNIVDNIKLTQDILKYCQLFNNYQNATLIEKKARICKYNNLFMPQYENYNIRELIHDAEVFGFNINNCKNFDDIIESMTIEKNKNTFEAEKMIKDKIIDKSLEIIFNK